MAPALVLKHGALFASTSNIRKHPKGGIMRFAVYTVALFTLCNVSLFAWDDNYLGCVATNDGLKELHSGEHMWVGHITCGECLEAHDDCTMRCNEFDFTAVAEGIDVYGKSYRVEATDLRSSTASVKAMDKCYYDQHLGQCHIVDEKIKTRFIKSYQCERIEYYMAD